MKSYIELLNKKNYMDGSALLSLTPDNSVSCCFFDPQYRSILDKMNYGNEGARQVQRASLPQMSVEVISLFLEEIYRTIVPSGYLFFWVDKFGLCEGLHLKLFKNILANDTFKTVDMITWDKMSFGMGYRSRRTSEYLLICQKEPITTKTWTDRSIRDVWQEKILSPRKVHPHKKPLGLIMRLIESVTLPNELVLDPCAGSFVVMDIALACSRNFLGCDLVGDTGES